jgi:hypothetical protein
MQPRDDRGAGVFSICESLAEVIIAVDRVAGPDGVERFLADAGATRGMLREAADSLRLVGLTGLSAAVRKCVRRSPPSPPTFEQRRRRRIMKAR